jgi:hypothetical protein
MAQAKTQAQATQPLPIREVSIQEIVAMAIHKRRKEGKSSLRVELSLPPSMVPPPSGSYTTAVGDVSLKSIFKATKGRWFCIVKFPQEGFKLADFLPNPPSQPSDTQNPQK